MKKKPLAWLGLILFTLIALLYDRTVPLYEKPDELKHFAVIHHIQTTHTLPLVEAGVYRPYDQEGTQPPLFHLIAAGATMWLNLNSFDEPPRNPHYVDDRSFIWYERGNNNLYLHAPADYIALDPVLIAAQIARWISLLCALLTLGLTYKLARLTFPSELWLPLVATAFVAFVPQFMHVSTAITNDSLSTTLATATLWLIALTLQHGRAPRTTIGLGVCLGLGALTKLSLLYLAPVVGLIFAVDALRRWRYGSETAAQASRQLLVDGLTIGGLMLLIAGWWFARNALLYGDVTALNAHLLYRGGPLDPTPTLYQLWQTELTGLELTFWGAFGAGQILFEPMIYEGLRGLKYLILLGLLIGIGRAIMSQSAESAPFTSTKPILALLFGWALLIVAALFRWMQITPASWGRLLFPALPAIAILAVWSLAQCRLKRWPRSHLIAPTIVVAFLFLLAVSSPFRYLQAAYSPPPLLTSAELPSYTPLNLTQAEGLRLLGYRVEKEVVQAGAWLPVTLYWQATNPINHNYSVFVHALVPQPDGTWRKIGQSNSYPARGNWPTSFIPTGGIIADTHYLPLEPQAEAPALLYLAMGLFDFADPQRTALPLMDDVGNPVQPLMATIPLYPHQWPDLTSEYAVDFGDTIRLKDYDLQPTTLALTVTLTLQWQVLQPPSDDLTLFIHLVRQADGAQIAGFDAPPLYPTRLWQTGQSITDTRRLQLPPDLPDEAYQWVIGWYHPQTFARLGEAWTLPLEE